MINRGSEFYLTAVIWEGVLINGSGLIFVKQVLIGGYLIDWGVILLTLIAKIKQTMHKLGISLSL